jgi:hypothetical protein
MTDDALVSVIFRVGRYTRQYRRIMRLHAYRSLRNDFIRSGSKKLIGMTVVSAIIGLLGKLLS